jgi:putative ABC transport system permease protein
MKWLKQLFSRERRFDDLSAEIREHIEERTAELVANGMSREEATHAARREFGNVTLVEEDARGAWRWSSFESLLSDIRFGARTLRKSRGFTAVAILTLALGIGATTAIFSVIRSVLLNPLAMADPGRVVVVREVWQDVFPSLSVGNFADVRRQNISFSGMCALNPVSFNLATKDNPVRVQGETASAGCFPTLGVAPIAGRFFTEEEDQPGHAPVVMLSERLWRRRLSADTAIVGRPLRLDGEPYVVVGIMPSTFDPFLGGSELWVPHQFTAGQLAEHDNHFLNVLARLKPGVSLSQAQSELNVIARRLAQDYPLDDGDRGLTVGLLTGLLLGDQRQVLRIMLAAVGFVLLIACANIANLQLALSRTRQKEMALRAALGASRKRLVRQLLVENLVLGLASGITGVLLAYWGLSWIVAHGPAEMPRLNQSRIDAGAMLFACLIAMLSSVVFGLVPALRSASVDLSQTAKRGDASANGGKDYGRSTLVVCEVALALILMAGAGLLIRSALLVARVDPGFDTTNLVVGRVGLPEREYANPQAARQSFEAIVRAASEIPGVQSAAVVSRAPMSGSGNTNGLIAEGMPLDPKSLVNARLQVVTPGYLSTLRIPIKAGQDFTPQDTRETRFVTIVNESLARTLWPGQNAIGKRFACCEPGPKGRSDPMWHEVIGVVADVHAFGLDREDAPAFYLPMAQIPPQAWDWIGRTMDLTVRTQGAAAPDRALQETVASIAPGVPIYQLSTMQQKIGSTLERSHFDTFLMSLFAATALLLSSVGIYGVLSYMVAQRTRDIGIRMALGATQGRVVGDVLWHGARLTAAGIAIGIAGALASAQLLSSMLYGIRATDGVTLGITCAVLAAAALLASYLPALRATRVDPMVALRHD